MAHKYQKIDQPKEQIPENEIRVKANNSVALYLNRAHTLLTGTHDHVVIKGVSHAVDSVVRVAELIKHRIENLHQTNEIKMVTFHDEYEPLEEGLDHLKFER